MRRTRAKPIYAVLAGVVLALLVMPIALAGGAEDPEATASASVEKQIKKLKKQVKKLRQQVQEVSKQPGPAGEQGSAGEQGLAGQQGPPGPSTGPAGGDLTGTYPNPQIGSDAVGTVEIAIDAVTNRSMAIDAVESRNIKTGAVALRHISAGSVDTGQIADGAVRGPDLGPTFAVVGTGVLVSPGTSREATVTCPGNSRLLGGGFEWLSEDADGSSVISSSPAFVGDPNKTWVVTGRSDTGGAGNTIFAEALCLAV